MSFTVRPMTIADLPTIVTTAATLVPPCGSANSFTSTSRDQLLHSFASGRGDCLVAVADAQIVGYALADHFRQAKRDPIQGRIVEVLAWGNNADHVKERLVHAVLTHFASDRLTVIVCDAPAIYDILIRVASSVGYAPSNTILKSVESIHWVLLPCA